MATPDYPDYATPAAHAGQIAVAGVPLLHGSDNLINAQNQALGAGAQRDHSAAFTKPGYDIFLTLMESVAGAVAPQATIIMNWGDTVSLTSVYAESWDPYIGTVGNAHQVKGYGPSRGDNLVCSVINHDSVQLNYNLVISQNSRVPQVAHWYSDFMNGVNGLPSANDDVESLIVAGSGPSLAAGANALRAIGLYNGRCRIRGFSQGPYRVLVQANDPNLPGTPITIEQLTVTAAGGGSASSELVLPRSQCQLQLFNDDTVTRNVNAAVIGEPI